MDEIDDFELKSKKKLFYSESLERGRDNKNYLAITGRLNNEG